MISETKTGAEKEPFRFPALVSLAPKRRFRAVATPKEEPGGLRLNEDFASMSLDVPRRRRLKRSGRIVLRWPSHPTGLGPVASIAARCAPYTP